MIFMIDNYNLIIGLIKNILYTEILSDITVLKITSSLT